MLQPSIAKILMWIKNLGIS